MRSAVTVPHLPNILSTLLFCSDIATSFPSIIQVRLELSTILPLSSIPDTVGKNMNVVIPGASPQDKLQSGTASQTRTPNPAYLVKPQEILNPMPLEHVQSLSSGSGTLDFAEWAKQIRVLASEETREVDAKVIKDLLDAMKTTVGALGGTFDILGTQATKLAELGPAIDVKHKVRRHTYTHTALDEIHRFGIGIICEERTCCTGAETGRAHARSAADVE